MVNRTKKYSGGRKRGRLCNVALFAEKELEERNKLMLGLFIPEEGIETTNQEEYYLRSGMLERQGTCQYIIIWDFQIQICVYYYSLVKNVGAIVATVSVAAVEWREKEKKRFRLF